MKFIFGVSLVLITLAATINADSDVELTGPNVCKKTEDYILEVVVTEKQAYQERESVWCWSVPPRCSKYRIKFRTVNKTQNLTKTRLVKECCAGYGKNKKGDMCIPICTECKHGECVAPEICRCDAGYGGPACDINCPTGYWGRECSKKCDCLNNSTCDQATGVCNCAKGFIGERCEKKCSPDRFGLNCTETCRCKNGGSCHHISGECSCAAGFTGPLCDETCPEGKHGQECGQECVNCETQCPPGLYGENCEKECLCLNNSSCDPKTGKCICSRGWIGDTCGEPCPEGYYGHGCKEKCPNVVYGNKSCNHVTGEYVCRPGYIGLTCEHPCPAGTYGPHCSLKCMCEHGAECSHITGQCQCAPGWTGSSCNVPCPDGYYGQSCSQTCRCKNSAKCRKNDGHCVCFAGFMGTNCEDVCPEGYYGQHCLGECACKSDKFVCHAAHGCICRQGFVGDDCSKLKHDAQEQVKEESNSAGVAWGVTVSLLFVAVIILVLMYYRRRIRDLKTTIADVEFHANPQTQPDRHHFDNPVYAFQTAGNTDNTQLLNNLRPSKPTNLERYKLGISDTDSNASSRAGTYSVNFNSDTSQKNYNADMTNPNVYQFIDENNGEHVYDEIVQKEAYKDPDEYDHLDYSRPASSFKQHYHRMNDTLNITQEEPEIKENNLNINNLNAPAESPVDNNVPGSSANHRVIN